MAENERAELAAAVNAERLRNERARAQLAQLQTELVSAPSSPVPNDVTSKNALEQLVWGLVTGAEFRFNH